jgi:hypothetical protein
VHKRYVVSGFRLRARLRRTTVALAEVVSRTVIIGLIAIYGPIGSAHAQGFVAVRGGTNLVGNTYRVRESKAEPGAGGSIGASLSPLWAVEFETWIRAANPECCGPRRRETLYSLSVVRMLAREGLQPYMIGGLTFLSADDPEIQVQVGVGAQFPVYRRLSMAIDLRGNGGSSTMIVRPTAAVIYYFH